jgi:hypothetical protein
MSNIKRIDLQSRRKLSFALTATAFVSVVLTIVCCSVDGWVKTTTDSAAAEFNGLFVENGTNSFYCDGDMSVTECGFLQGSKSCAIISGIFGFFALLVGVKYIKYSDGYLTSLGASLVAVCGLLQTIFGIICVVYYSYLFNSYFTYDDLNVEYPDNKKSVYDWAYILQCISVGLSFVYTLALYIGFVVFNNDGGGAQKKNYAPLGPSGSGYHDHSGMRSF